MISPEEEPAEGVQPVSQEAAVGSPLVPPDVDDILRGLESMTDAQLAGFMRHEPFSGPYSFKTDTSLTESQVKRCLVSTASQSLPSIPGLSLELRILEGPLNSQSLPATPPPLMGISENPVKSEPPAEEEEDIDVCNVSPEPPPKKLKLDAPGARVMTVKRPPRSVMRIKPRASKEGLKNPTTPQIPRATSSPAPDPPLQYPVKEEITTPSPTAQSAVSPAGVSRMAVERPFRVVALPQDKTSRNLDYVGGVKGDIHSPYFLFCRDDYEVPFHIYVAAHLKEAAVKMRVEVLTKSKKHVSRCRNHQDTYRSSTPTEQFLLALDHAAVPFPSGRGSGFVVSPVPPDVKIKFFCRNSCDIKHTKQLQLTFVIFDQGDRQIGEQLMELKVCQVPLRDIVKEGVVSSVVPGRSGGFSLAPLPLCSTKVVVKAEVNTEAATDVQEELTGRTNSSVHVIYVNGSDAYSRVMAAVKAEEDLVRQEPGMDRLSRHMNKWTRDTPIEELLVACGVEMSKSLGARFRQKGIPDLGALSKQFDLQLVRLQLTPVIAKKISTVFLNWYNTLIFNELNATTRDADRG